MQIGLVGLGKMGGNMARRWLAGGHQVVVTDLRADVVAELEAEGASGAKDVPALVEGLDAPRAVWVMLPAGDVTEGMVGTLGRFCRRVIASSTAGIRTTKTICGGRRH